MLEIIELGKMEHILLAVIDIKNPDPFTNYEYNNEGNDIYKVIFFQSVNNL